MVFPHTKSLLQKWLDALHGSSPAHVLRWYRIKIGLWIVITITFMVTWFCNTSYMINTPIIDTINISSPWSIAYHCMINISSPWSIVYHSMINKFHPWSTVYHWMINIFHTWSTALSQHDKQFYTWSTTAS